MSGAGRVIGWAVSPGLTDYRTAEAAMAARAEAIAEGAAGPLVWLLEHPPLYTAGTSARAEDLRDPGRFPVYDSGRGGQYTYHGPGQRVVYVMLDLKTLGRDVRRFVCGLERWLISALGELGVAAVRRDGRVGVWVVGADGREAKIAATGVRLRRWVSFHGVALNVAPDLSHYGGITPCGLDPEAFGVTSLAALGAPTDMARVDAALRRAFEAEFGATEDAAAPDLSPAGDLARAAGQG